MRKLMLFVTLHRLIDVLYSPVVIIPEDITREDCLHMVIDAGHIGVISKLPTQAELKELRNRQGRAETEEEVRMRERLAYSKFVIQLQSTQVVMGDRLAVCMEALSAEQAGPNHLLAKINMDWIAESRIAPPVADVEQFRLSGHLPDLSISMSDRKYRSLMRMVDVAVPNFDSNDPGEDVTGRPRANSRASASRGRPRSKSISFAGTRYEEDEDEDLIDEADDERDDFFEAPEFKDRVSRVFAFHSLASAYLDYFENRGVNRCTRKPSSSTSP